MKTDTLAINKIQQLDNHSFQITWNDGSIAAYRLNELQEQCPCAGCVDEFSGRRIAPAAATDKNVKAFNIQSVGRYALKIKFSSGCSTGIYSYKMLHKIFTVSKL